MRFVIVVLALLGLGMVSGVTTPALAAAIDSGYAFVMEQQPGPVSIQSTSLTAEARGGPIRCGLESVSLRFCFSS